GPKLRPPGMKVQDGYSLRCLAQYNGVNFEKIKSILDTITINANSVSDNPVWVPPEKTTPGEKSWQWVSGGNFIAMHMVEAIDSLRKIMTQIVKVNDRHLARLIDTNENNGLPPNLSDKKAITQSSFKGVQVHSGMLEVYSSLLSIPVSTFFGTHEEGNQDITSHALTSAIIGMENLRLTRYSIAQNLLSVAQAVDLRGGKKYLSPKTRPVYELIRNKVRYVDVERPLANDIEVLYDSIIDGSLMNLIRNKVINDYEK
ncbi:MAG: aromatic amino acid lyase, partial [Patescibacteria group bacterium]